MEAVALTSRYAFDVSLVLNTRAGSIFLTRTLRSLEEAAFMARETGLRLELVFIMNDSPPSHLRLVGRYTCAVYDDIVIVEVSHASLGAARQDGLAAARGEYICFADDDDLISFNSIVAFYKLAKQAGHRSIVVPRWLATFGHYNFVAEYQASTMVSPLLWIKYHPFVSRIFLHAAVREHLSYADVAPGSGYAYEDWHFNAGAIARGYEIVSAPGTVLFYRQRPAGLLAQFDAEASRQIPPSPFFRPDIYLRLCGEAAANFDGNGAVVDGEAVRRTFADDPDCRVATLAASHIDPSVDWDMICAAAAWANRLGDQRPGAAYYDACRIVRGLTFDHVIVCQSSSDRGTARRLRLIVDAVRTSWPDARFLVLAADGPDAAARTVPGTTVVHLGALYPALPEGDVDAIALRLIENTAATARLHLFGGAFARRFYQLYRRILSRNRAIYYRDADRVRFADRLPDLKAPDIAFLSEVLPSLSLVVNDCLYGMARDQALFGVYEERWAHCYALPPASLTAASVHEAGGVRRLLWITNGEDPNEADLVRLVDEALSSSGTALGLTVVTEACQTETPEDGELAQYEGVIHTAPVETLPLVLLDALAAGVPVIGVAGGGVAEAVVDGQSGWLIAPGPADEVAPLLLDAIRQCRRGSEAHAERSAGARRRAGDMRGRGGVEAMFALADDGPVVSEHSLASSPAPGARS